MLCDPVCAPLVALTELAIATMTGPEAIVAGLVLTSCDVVMEMPLGTSFIGGPIVKPVSVATTVEPQRISEFPVSVSTMLVAVGAALVEVPAFIVTVGADVVAKKPLG